MILSGHYQMSLAPLERLDPYGGTFDIVRTLSNVPSHFGQLIMTKRSLSNVPGTFGEAGPQWRDI